jgi:hypothetical protein
VLVVAIGDTPELKVGEIPHLGCTHRFARRWSFSLRLYKLDFIQSRGITEGVSQALEEWARDLYEVVIFLGQ